MIVRVWILEITRESKQSPCKRVVSNGNLRVDVTLFPKRRYHVPRSKEKREMETETETKTKTKREVESLTISANIVFVGFSRRCYGSRGEKAIDRDLP